MKDFQFKPEETARAAEELKQKARYDFYDLVRIMKVLRSPGGCPWDREQTHMSIRNNLIEETYEVIEAIDKKDPKLLREELGDLLLQVIFHARMEEEQGGCDISDVVQDICVKLIHRHPHIFAAGDAKTSEEVLDRWEEIKKEEKKRETLSSQLDAIPPHLPALIRSEKIGKKTEFWEGKKNTKELLDALSGMIEEMREMPEDADGGAREEGIGNLLFTVSDLCRALSVKGETALSHASDRRVAYFRRAEELADGKPLSALTDDEKREICEQIEN